MMIGLICPNVEFVQLDNIKILPLMPDNQFATKLFLEREDRTWMYLCPDKRNRRP